MQKLILFLLFLFYNSKSSFAKIQIAITINDLPSHSNLSENTSRLNIAKKMISVLKKYNIPEVYWFVNGNKLENKKDDIEVLKYWTESGYPLGNQTYSHFNLNNISVENFIDDIKKNEILLKQLNDKNSFDWKYFRYPYLYEGDTLEKRNKIREYLQNNNYKISQVTIDFEDCAYNSIYSKCVNKKDNQTIDYLKELYFNNATEELKQSQIIADYLFKKPIRHILLLHIGNFTADTLDELIKTYLANDVEFISLSDALKDDIYLINPNIVSKSVVEFTYQIMKSRNITLQEIGIKKNTHFTEEKLIEINKLCN